MTKSKAILSAFLLAAFSPCASSPRTDQPSPELEAHLKVLTVSTPQEGGQLKVRVEIQNICNHPVLVWRDMKWISSAPFRMEVFLEDSSGKQYLLSRAAVADVFDIPDLQIRNGMFEWRIPLYPKTLLGSDLDLELRNIPVGKYLLRGRYLVGRPAHKETDLERKLTASNFSIFQGTLETNTVPVEVLPRNPEAENSTR